MNHTKDPLPSVDGNEQSGDLESVLGSDSAPQNTHNTQNRGDEGDDALSLDQIKDTVMSWPEDQRDRFFDRVSEKDGPGVDPDRIYREVYVMEASR